MTTFWKGIKPDEVKALIEHHRAGRTEADPVVERIRLENQARRMGYDVKYIWTAVHDSMANRQAQDTAAFNREFERTLHTIAYGRRQS